MEGTGQHQGAGPLSGVRVLDLTRMIAGPFAAMALGELGAEVIKIERTRTGDDTRAFGPFLEDGTSTYYMAFNRNKRSVEADLSTEEGQQIVRRIALEWADVVVENYKDGTLEAWGIGMADLRAEKPSLITATVRGYPVGDSRPGYDFVIQAGTGLMSLTGEEDGDYMRVGLPVADLFAGQYLTSGIVSALYERSRSGLGEHVSVSLWESQVSLLTFAAQQYLLTGSAPPRVGNQNASAGPYGVFSTATKQVAVCCGNDRQFAGFCREFDVQHWHDDPRFGSNQLRAKNRAELGELTEKLFASLDATEVIRRLEAAGVPCGPVQDIPTLLDEDPSGRAMVTDLPDDDGTVVPVVRMPWRFDRTEAQPRSVAPTLGEASAELDDLLGS